MKCKVLVSYYQYDGGKPIALRVYLESDFEQAQKDLDMILETNSDKEYKLIDSEVFNLKFINTIQNTK